MATTTRPIHRFPATTPSRSRRVWNATVRKTTPGKRFQRWLYVALGITLMLTFIGWLVWLSVMGPDNVSLPDVWMP